MSIFQLSHERGIGIELIESTTGLEVILIIFGVVGAIPNAMALIKISTHMSLLQKHFSSLTLFTFNFVQSLESLYLAIQGDTIFRDIPSALFFIHRLIITGQLFSFVLVILENIFHLRMSAVNKTLDEQSRRDNFHIILFLVILAGAANLFTNIRLKSLEMSVYVLVALTVVMYIFLMAKVYSYKPSNPIQILSKRRTLVYLAVIFGLYAVLFASKAFSHSTWYYQFKPQSSEIFNWLFLILLAVNHIHLLTDPLIFYICHTKVKKIWQRQCRDALSQVRLMFCFCTKRDPDYTISRKVYAIPCNSRANSINSRAN